MKAPLTNQRFLNLFTKHHLQLAGDKNICMVTSKTLILSEWSVFLLAMQCGEHYDWWGKSPFSSSQTYAHIDLVIEMHNPWGLQFYFWSVCHLDFYLRVCMTNILGKQNRTQYHLLNQRQRNICHWSLSVMS